MAGATLRTTPRLCQALAVAAASALPLVALPGPATAGGGEQHPAQRPGHRTTQIQVLSFNDLHGHLQAPAGSSGRVTTGYTEVLDPTRGGYVAAPHTVVAGGVEYLATHLAQARDGHHNSVTVAAGDIVGASPLLSAAFHDEPTIESMNALGLDATAVGNHEFDEGYREVQRLARGGCLDDGDGTDHQNSCADHRFAGARFPILAANVRYTGSRRTILPPYWIKRFPGGARIAFIGMTLKETPSIVTRSGIRGLTVDDEAVTANRLVPVLRRRGVRAIVVLVHQGGTPATTTYTAEHGSHAVAPPYDATCSTRTQDGVRGSQLTDDSPVLDITRRLDPQIDLVVSGHTHQPYVCSQPDPFGRPRLITSASSFGRLFTETTLTYDLRTRDVQRTSVVGSNVVVTRDVAKDLRQSALIATYDRLVRPIADTVLGRVAGAATLSKPGTDEETSLGRLIADAQQADPSAVRDGVVPQVAFMNPGASGPTWCRRLPGMSPTGRRSRCSRSTTTWSRWT